MEAFSPRPEEITSQLIWDGADQTFFRPISRFFAVDPGGEAVNVNSMDEVPDSSWFTNRVGRYEFTRDELLSAACDESPLDPAGPWTVTDAKPNGANPGFIVEDAEGRKYLLKFDGIEQPERATSADVLGSILYWAAGYWAPCNRVVFFDRSIVRIASDAMAEDASGNEIPMTEEHIATILEKAYVLPDGRFRASASRFLPGRPIGPWTYQDVRDDDPNDVVPHEDRRELRGAYVLASWLNHFDAREQNTLAIWVATEGERGYVRHYYLDFGDCFGSLWEWDGVSRRLGHSYYLDLPHLVEDFLTFGAIGRPWEQTRFGVTGSVLGYFDLDRFEPDAYRTGYPNPAFVRMTERDAAWMARVIARISEADVRAIVSVAEIANPVVHDELLRVLLGRRERILRRWFRNVSPLSEPRVTSDADGTRLCFEDLGHQVYRAHAVEALVRMENGDAGEVLQTTSDGSRLCVQLPTTVAQSNYVIVEARAPRTPEDSDVLPIRVHLHDSTVLGVER